MPTQAKTPETTPYEEQLGYLKVAIWTIQFRNRFPAGELKAGRYDSLNRHLLRAQKYATGERSVPGGPALRLAKAAQALDYRLLFPNDLQLQLREERSTSHLYYYHRDVKKSRTSPVWKAMEEFFRIRTAVLGGIPVPADKKEDIFAPNPFTKALRRLDTLVNANRRLRQRLVFKQLMLPVATTHPSHRTLLVPVLEAAHAYASWLLKPEDHVNIRNLRLGYETLLKAQNANIAHLNANEPALNKAINALLYDIRLPLS